MRHRHIIAASLLSLVATVASFTFTETALATPPATSEPASAPVNYLELAYHSAWNAIKGQYTDSTKLTELADWENKFDGKLHTQQGLDQAIDALIRFSGGQIRLLSTSDVAALEVARVSQELSWGMQAQFEPESSGHRSLSITAGNFGPAQQAGILTDDIVESVNGGPADRLSATEVETLNGNCQLGQSLRIKLARLAHPITLTCGPAPVEAHDSFSVDTASLPAGNSSTPITLVRIKPTSLDDSRLRDSIHQSLSGTDGKSHAVLFDLRDTGGSNYARLATIAALFMQQGTLACEAPRQDQVAGVCYAVDNNKATQFAYDPKFKLASFKSHDGPIVVLLDGNTSGTALNLAAALQSIGAKVITTGADATAKTRGFDDEPAYVRLLGDPMSRTISVPKFHITQAPNAGKTFDTDDVEATDEAALGKAGGIFGTKDPLTDASFGAH
jgi:C-terminal processing protease CtpA/Prc